MRVDLSRIVSAQNLKSKNKIIDEYLEGSEENNDPIMISDLVIDCNDSYSLMKALVEDEQEKYILFVMLDEWGTKPQKGDKVKRQFKRDLIKDGVPIPVKTLNYWKRTGQYEKKRYYYKEYTVDGKGCIKVNARDAEYFINLYGVHPVSGMPITVKPELSPGPCKRKDGSHKHVHYHRFKEMDLESYKALPKLVKEKPNDGEQNRTDTNTSGVN